MEVTIMRRGWWYRPAGWWCPRHPWTPGWARAPPHLDVESPYPADPQEELKTLEHLRRDLEIEISGLAKRIDELKKILQEKT